MSTNCAPLVADLFLSYYDGDFLLSLSEDTRSDVNEVFKSTSRYLDDLHQLNKANVSDTEASFLDLHLSISESFVKTKMYDKRNYFDFDIPNFSFLDRDVPRSTSYGVYISQLIRFACVSSHADDFDNLIKF